MVVISQVSALELVTDFAAVADSHSILLMRRSFLTPVSIVSSVSCLLLPFLFSAIAVILCNPRLFLFPCAVKGFLFSYAHQCFLMHFGDSSAVLHSLFFFSDHVSVLLLFWLWIRHIRSFGLTIWRDIIICIVCVSVAALFSQRFIIPIITAIAI